MERSPPCWEGSGEPRSPCVILISDRVLPSPKGCRAFVPPSQPSPRPAATPLPPPPFPGGLSGWPRGVAGMPGEAANCCLGTRRFAASPASGAGRGGEGRAGSPRARRSLRSVSAVPLLPTSWAELQHLATGRRQRAGCRAVTGTRNANGTKGRGAPLPALQMGAGGSHAQLGFF